jgi:hypothetical protein
MNIYPSFIDMESNNKVTVEALITCSFCKELFDDPRLVPCSHTYCRECIEKIASENGEQFECSLHDQCKVLKKTLTHCLLIGPYII